MKNSQDKNKKNINSGISKLGLEIKKTTGVTEFTEKTPSNGSSVRTTSHTGNFKFNGRIINYIIINASDISFINFRMNIEYNKQSLSDEVRDRSALLENINNQNSKTVGIKFFIMKEDDEKFVVSVNSEYILDNNKSDYSFVIHAMTFLSVTPGILKIKNTEE